MRHLTRARSIGTPPPAYRMKGHALGVVLLRPWSLVMMMMVVELFVVVEGAEGGSERSSSTDIP